MVIFLVLSRFRFLFGDFGIVMTMGITLPVDITRGGKKFEHELRFNFLIEKQNRFERRRGWPKGQADNLCKFYHPFTSESMLSALWIHI